MNINSNINTERNKMKVVSKYNRVNGKLKGE